MPDYDYIDVLITDNDLTLDVAGEVQFIYDKDCITQDIKHCIRDSGLMVEIVGQRDEGYVRDDLQNLQLLIEDDVRLIPGSVDVDQTSLGVFFITANTYKYGNINFQVTL